MVIVGGKNSACEAALELYRNGAHVTLVHRGAALGDSVKYWVKPDIENRISEGAVAARFNTHITEIRPTEVVVRDRRRPGPLGRSRPTSVLLLTGYRADPEFLRRAGVEVNAETLEPTLRPGDVRDQCARTSSSPAASWRERGPGRFSSRTAGFTASASRGSARQSH